MSLLVLKLLTIFNLFLGITAYVYCKKYTHHVLGPNSDAAPIVVKSLIIRTFPENLNYTINGYFGYNYETELWYIEAYKGHELLAKYFNETTVDDVSRYSKIERRLNLTGFWRPQINKSDCWKNMTIAMYYFMFLHIDEKGRLAAFEDMNKGAYTPWSEDNVTLVEHGIGWSDWSDWSICSSKCGNGTQERWRYCDRPQGCPGWNKEKRWCNAYSCEGLVDPLQLKSEQYFHPTRRQWERVPGRETAWHLKKDSYVWLPGNEVSFPKINFQEACSLIISLRVHSNGQKQGTILSLKSRSQKNAFLSIELYESEFIRVVHSRSNNTVHSFVIAEKIGDGKWHQIAIGILDDNRVRSYVDCYRAYINYNLSTMKSLNAPDDADLVIGYLFTGDIEQLLWVPNPEAIEQQCNEKSTIKFLDRDFLNATRLSFPPTKIPPDLSNIGQLVTTTPLIPTEDPMDHFVLTSYLTKRRTFPANITHDKKFNDPRHIQEYQNEEPSTGDSELHPFWEKPTNGSKVASTEEIGPRNKASPEKMLGDQPFEEDPTSMLVVMQDFSPKEEREVITLRDDEEADDDTDLAEGSGLGDPKMYEVEWSPWSKCSAQCGGGTQTRHSRCVDANVHKLELCLQTGDERVETRKCNFQPCNSQEHKKHHGRRNMAVFDKLFPGTKGDFVLDKDISTCPCLNGGHCIKFEPHSAWPYLKVELRRKCLCKGSFTGELCEAPVCKKPCLNGGICVKPDVCYCSKLYTGLRCETAICNPPCENEGECIQPGVCSCKSGFGHPRCKPICPGGCGPNGVCTAPGKCTCHPGYHGLLCGEKVMCAHGCANGGVCARENVCQCQSGWTGFDCNIPICEPPCNNGGTCVAPNHCFCPVGTIGPDCNTLNCTSDSCTNVTYPCSFNSTGILCEKLSCDPPCLHGGTCAFNNVCICSEVAMGHRCEIKKCEMRLVQEPYTRGFRRLAKTHQKCRNNNLRLCVKQFPHYETVYKTYYQTQYRCIQK
uniref:von Willebrand factor D and EGF domain-containing protein n=1 Tax=Cacopsylla melanoneura TaxID=428564 RepID=A0A8D8WII8_9HEMI